MKKPYRRKKISSFYKFYIPLILIFFYAPIVSLIIFSFNASKSLTRWDGFSLIWYQELFNNADIWEAVFTTITIAVLATIISTILGTLGAIGITKSKNNFRNFILNINNLPVVNPEIVTAVAFMVMFVSMKLPQGAWTMLLAHIAFCTPYVVISVYPKMRAMDENLIEAALDLGATPTQALLRVIIPELKPSIAAGAVLAFTMSFDDFIISYFTCGDATNISIYLYTLRRINPTVNALSTLIIGGIGLLVLIGQLFKFRKKKIDLKWEAD